MKAALKKLLETGSAVLPPAARRWLAAAEYRLACLPGVFHDPAVHPPKGLPRGAVTISLDFELAWAWQYAKGLKMNAVEMGLLERRQVPRILSIFEELDIPATWATVGHLFLERCSRDVFGLAHGDLPRPLPFRDRALEFASGDWYQFDPCSSVHQAPAWYAPDLVEKILSSPSWQEIACHGFSHAGFGRSCPKGLALAELDACLSAMDRFGIRPKSFVFPRNEEGNFEALAEKGFRIVRWFPKRAAGVSLPVRRKEDGLWCVHASSDVSRGEFRWTRDERLARLKRFVDAAEKTRLAAHVWLHPSLPAADIEEILTPFLRYCADKRERGVLDVLTMETLVQATEAAFSEQPAR